MAAIPDWQQPYKHIGPHKLNPVETVVLPLWRSASKAALPVARRLAELYGATLHIVCVCEELAGARQTLQDLGVTSDEIRGAVVDQLAGDPRQQVLAAMRRVPEPLLVMSAQGTDQSGGGSPGPVAETLLNSNLDRVLLVALDAAREDWNLSRILLAHDGAPSTEVATSEAAELALRAGAEVLAMHVAARTSSEPLEPGSISAPRYLDQPQHEWPAWANEFLDRMIALGAPPVKVRFKLMVTGGQPGSEVADFARENHSDLVVAAWHGGWNAEEQPALKAIVRRSGCPVLMVYAPELHQHGEIA